MTNLIVLISGKQGAGKSTLAKNLSLRALEKAPGASAFVWRYADPLDAMEDGIKVALERFGVNDLKFPDGNLKQTLGDWGRNIKPGFFTSIITSRLVHLFNQMSTHPRIVIIEDVRFKNEVECIESFKASGVKVLKVRLEAPEHVRQVRAAKWRSNVVHKSEIDLDTYDNWDMCCWTDSTNAEIAANAVWKEIEERLCGIK